MTATSERLLTALETEITNVSKLEHVLARTRVVLREHATRLRPREGYTRQVAPPPSTYWRSTGPRVCRRPLNPTEAPRSDRKKRSGRPGLTAPATGGNREPRGLWGAARRSALAVGLVESEYFPA